MGTYKSNKTVKINLFLIFFFFLICNALLNLVSDDYSYIWERLENGTLSAIINSYLYHNARFGQLLSICYIGVVPNLVFDICNAILGAGFVTSFFALIKGSTPSDKKDVFSLWLIIALFISLNAFGSIFIWETGSANYLHGFFVWSLCLIPYRKFWGQKLLGENHKKSYPWLITFSIFAGWSFEQLGIITILIFILFFVISSLKKIQLPLWYWLGFILFVIGYCLLYFAPGESVRGVESETYIDIISFLKEGLHFQITRLVNGFQQYHSKQYMFYLFFLIIFLCYTSSFIRKKWLKMLITIISCALALIVEKFGLCILDSIFIFTIILIRCLRKTNIETAVLNRILCGLFFFYIFSCCCAALVPFPMRAKFCGDIFLIISIVLIIRHYYSKVDANICNICTRILYVYVSVACCLVIAAYADYRIKWETALSEAQEQVNNGNSDIIMDKSVFTSFYPFLGDWINPGENPEVWPNVSYSEHFGWNSLTVK